MSSIVLSWSCQPYRACCVHVPLARTTARWQVAERPHPPLPPLLYGKDRETAVVAEMDRGRVPLTAAVPPSTTDGSGNVSPSICGRLFNAMRGTATALKDGRHAVWMSSES